MALCAICSLRSSIYTCPRCSTRTCSFPCSSAHKSRNKCSGERDKTAYVPMNKYGWGTMMNDYVFLEDVGRKVEEWGREIVRGGLRTTESRGNGMMRGNGRMRGTRTKRDVLKMQLEFQEIEMELLPAGMNRRKLNQSFWDHKKKTACLTIEFKFHHAPSPPFVLLTHQNNLETPLLSLLRTRVSGPKIQKDIPDWVKSMVCEDADDLESFTLPDCIMRAQVDPVSSLVLREKVGYYKLDATQTLSTVLRHKYFVEYPTIEIWEEFRGTIVDTEGAITHYAEEERAPKRRRLNVKAGKKAMKGLVGGYGSDDDEDGGENAMSMLGGYAGSDDDENEEQPNDEDGDSDGDHDAVALPVVQSVEEDDEVDWGDSTDDDEDDRLLTTNPDDAGLAILS